MLCENDITSTNMTDKALSNSFKDYYKAENSEDEEENNELLDRLYAEIYYPSKDENESYSLNNNSTQCNNIIDKSTNKENSVQQKSENKESSKFGTAKRHIKSVMGTSTKNSEGNLTIQEVMDIIDLTNDNTSTAHEGDNINDKVSTSSLVMKEKRNKENSSIMHKSTKYSKTKHRETMLENATTTDMDTKYNVLQKKRKREMWQAVQHEETSEDSSDSEISIFEVPVPPKPKPLLINLQDSDEEDVESLRHKDPFLRQYRDTTNTIKNNNARFIEFTSPNLETEASSSRQNTTVKNRNTSKAIRNKNATLTKYVEDVDTSINTHDIVEDISLNCTMVQKGARNINEIKQSHKSVSTKKDQSNLSTVSTNSNYKKPQDTSRESNESNTCSLQEAYEIPTTSRKETQSQIKRIRKNVDDVEISKNCNATSPDDFRYNLRCVDQNLLKNTLVEVSYNDHNLTMSQKRYRDGNSKERVAEDSGSAKKRLRTVQHDEQNITSGARKNNDNKGRKRSESFWTEYFFKPMPEELKRFYNNTRSHENFDVEELQRKMPQDPRMWAILDEDLMPSPSRRRYFNNMKCNNSLRDGRAFKNSPEKICCLICGTNDHVMWNCPERMCLTCGTKQNYYFRYTCDYCKNLYCTMCRSIGHKMQQCPDLWRRYHHTTVETGRAPQHPGNVMKPASQLRCCNCTKRGHEYSTCKEYLGWSLHFATPAAVMNYTEGPVYESESARYLETSIPSKPSNISSSEAKSNKHLRNTPPEMNARGEAYLQLFSSNTNKSRTIALFKEEVTTTTNYTSPNFSQIIYTYSNFCDKKNMNMRVLMTSLSRHEEMSKQAKVFVQHKLSNNAFKPVFLNHLKGMIQFELKIGLLDKTEIVLELVTLKNCIYPLFRLLLYWLNLPDDEKINGLEILSIKPAKLLNFLEKLKLPEKLSNKKFRNPRTIIREIEQLKATMPKIQNNKYINKLKQIRGVQTKLLTILHTEPEPSVHIRNFPVYLEKIKQMQMCRQIDSAIYLEILLNYNNIFTPHTPFEIYAQEKKILKYRKLEKALKNEIKKKRLQETNSVSNSCSINKNPLPSSVSTPCTSQDIDFTVDPFVIDTQDTDFIVDPCITDTQDTAFTMDPFMSDTQNANYDISYKVTDNDVFQKISIPMENCTQYPQHSLSSNVQTISSQEKNLENDSQQLTNNIDFIPINDLDTNTRNNKKKKKKGKSLVTKAKYENKARAEYLEFIASLNPVQVKSKN